eukprot:Gregarina_sp_Pseudo_9__5725@NODE_830_length_2155_cov_7_899811_g778_i0_p1_GENE_NODE_830_length_2155_cov_7_899811_g778_i0NODE_830_length_2155_cov_7_899811_g778_i0_p1_ORF_typecomplete_len532_score184_06IIGP/PF05049_13/9_8e27GTP_EFTU/PF00009_27/0_0038FeoB_N/PF02421_18/0_0011ABC_tran/PF00005_27/4_8e03ABC_tran/PF00005_27/0_043MMR_HSR1/PF01926_23/0_2DUF4618/PF15397_6/8e03DUF4618/PF15397_6/51DUF4618/PF15397_6/0_23Cauli_AT/PF03233_13/0_28Cauli_AT/PF03233_13/7_3e03HMMR_C/PF15908_5/2_3DUF2730/PF10805_8/1_1
MASGGHECLEKYLRGDYNALSLQTQNLLAKVESAVDQLLANQWSTPVPEGVTSPLWVSHNGQFVRAPSAPETVSPMYAFLELKSRMQLVERECGPQPPVSECELQETTRWLKTRFLREPHHPVLSCLFEFATPPSPNVSGQSVTGQPPVGHPVPAISQSNSGQSAGSASNQVESVQRKNLSTLIFIHMAARVAKFEMQFDTVSHSPETETRQTETETRQMVALESLIEQKLRPLEERLETLTAEVSKAAQQEETRKPSSALSSLREGLEALVCVTPREMAAARTHFSFEPGYVHVAVVGRVESGTTSILNALVELASPEETGVAAQVMKALPKKRGRSFPSKVFEGFVLFDFPSAGSELAPQFQYFETQELFAFDVVCVVVDGRPMDTDLNVLRQCEALGIPWRLLRSKCDLQLQTARCELNKKIEQTSDFVWHDDDFCVEFPKAVSTFHNKEKESILAQLRAARLKHKDVFLVNIHSLHRQVSSTAKKTAPEPDDLALDEAAFIEDFKGLAKQLRDKINDRLPEHSTTTN